MKIKYLEYLKEKILYTFFSIKPKPKSKLKPKPKNNDNDKRDDIYPLW